MYAITLRDCRYGRKNKWKHGSQDHRYLVASISVVGERNMTCDKDNCQFVSDRDNPNRFVCLHCMSEVDITAEKEEKSISPFWYILLFLTVCWLWTMYDDQPTAVKQNLPARVMRVLEN